MPELALMVDVVMVFTAAEAALLWAWHRFTGRGLRIADYALNLLSGLLLMGALRGALVPGSLWWPLGCLGASGLCHALDLRLRWQRAQRSAAAARRLP